MKIESINRQVGKNQWSTPNRCPFCGHILKQIEGSNIKICTNKNCERGQSFYKLER